MWTFDNITSFTRESVGQLHVYMSSVAWFHYNTLILNLEINTAGTQHTLARDSLYRINVENNAWVECVSAVHQSIPALPTSLGHKWGTFPHSPAHVSHITLLRSIRWPPPLPPPPPENLRRN